jgi:NAD(P)-dependent dehydrogenase (short-subunit alcohol dehydrogenase family)
MSTSNSSVFQAGNTAVITGGASGIGLSLAKKCKSSGMNVIVCDVNSSSLETAKDVLTKTEGKGRVESLRVDVSKPSDYDSVTQLIEKEFDGTLK